MRIQHRPPNQPLLKILLGILASVAILHGNPAMAQLRQVAADTGRMAWGHKEYSRYTGADVCDRVVSEINFDMHRIYIPDTTGDEQSGEQLKPREIPASVLAAARSCADRFTVDGVDPRELWSMARIALVLGDDAKVRAAIDRRLKLDTTPVARAITLSTAIGMLMGGRAALPKLSMAEEYLKQLDAITPAQKVEQFEARLVFLRYWNRLYKVDSIRAYANRAIELSKSMTPEEQNNVELPSSYQALIDLANEAGDLDLQQKLLDSALEDVGAWRLGNGTNWTSTMTNLLDTRKSLYGKKTRPLNGTYWFNHNNTPRPVPGKISLIVSVDRNCQGNVLDCYPTYNLIKRLHKQYGDQLDITLIAGTNGFSLGTGPLTPADEAKEISDYFTNFIKIPAAILVDETPTSKRDDGRIIRGRSEIASVFANWRGANAILSDKEGRIRWLGYLNSKRMIDAAIDRAMKDIPTP